MGRVEIRILPHGRELRVADVVGVGRLLMFTVLPTGGTLPSAPTLRLSASDQTTS